jgi:hypothetical protein
MMRRAAVPLSVIEAAMKELAALVRSQQPTTKGRIDELARLADARVNTTWAAHTFEGPDLYRVTRVVL